MPDKTTRSVDIAVSTPEEEREFDRRLDEQNSGPKTPLPYEPYAFERQKKTTRGGDF